MFDLDFGRSGHLKMDVHFVGGEADSFWRTALSGQSSTLQSPALVVTVDLAGRVKAQVIV